MPKSCPKCGATSADNARFCEQDGTPLDGSTLPVPAAAAPRNTKPGCRCGAGSDANVDGYCSVCGRPWPKPRPPQPRDHVELTPHPCLAGVTDRGQRHERNEDDLALGVIEPATFVIVVCDGVSSTDRPERASAIAAKTVCEALKAVYSDEDAALREAIALANQAVCALESPPGAEPPATTLVAALVRGREILLGWVGDSRAYWLGSSTKALLTTDHSWFAEVVASGERTPEEASTNRLAHAITRCLGPADDEETSTPSLSRFTVPEEGGWILLCSDGFWNYASEPETITSLFTGEEPLPLAQALVDWANAQGGRDNITVALLDLRKPTVE